ncbi:ABC transporter substrate-binding protein [Pseudoflavonifractor phocaeensis]|uniref:ABC transporter substrate-binding protein n=1 Tax=Pseudoflavonifractor phocaeensis TaxID=1870988 RepID=UPI001956B0C0|nr:ABC transporter substrate-binding protein [Pseudoflavonifractor phocaeensis]MBM6924892.1 ABC transporter substrate-binding protein [Pseudoflavonifractor phocaeensis]
MKKSRILSLALAGALSFSMLAGCGGGEGGSANTPSGNSSTPAGSEETTPVSGGSASGTFKLGVIGPLTGGAAIYGTNVLNAAQIAVDEINALGGAVQFELISADDVHDPETSVNAYNNLMDQGMQVLVGTVTSGPALSVVPLAYEDRVFTVTPSASGDDVIEGNDNVFQVCFTDSNQGSRSAQYIDEHFENVKIAIIYKNDDPYSQGIRDNFAAEAETRGMEIVYEGTFNESTQTDFNNQLTSAQSAGADMIFLPIYYTPASVILTQANAMGYEPTFFGVDGMDGILTVPGFDTSLAEGVYLLTPFSADAEDEATQNFVSEYKSRHNDEIPNQFAADAYDAVYIVYEAIQAAGVTADMSNEEICDALIAAMGDLSVVGLTSAGSEMTWDDNGAVSKDPTAVVIEGGTYVTP